MTEIPAEVLSAPAPLQPAAWWQALWILPLAALLWGLGGYLALGAQQFPIWVSVGHGLAMAAAFYGLFLLPPLILFHRAGRSFPHNPFFSSRRILLGFACGMLAHFLALMIQKHLHLPYQVPWILLTLLLSYSALAYLLRPLRPWLEEEEYAEPPIALWISRIVLLLGLLLAWEFVLRVRASSLSLMGDAFSHMLGAVATQHSAPMPDGLPFYTTFILNIHPMAFHAILADIKTLAPELYYADLMRYFSLLMVPVFLFSLHGFFSYIAQSRLVGALVAFAALFVSGGGLSLRIPIVFFPWYWSIAWCLTAAVFFLLLKNLGSRGGAFWAGMLLGVGVLIHPMIAFRVGTILLFFLPLELLRRGFLRQGVKDLLIAVLYFFLGLAIPLALWLGPLLLRYPWEETYSYDYIVAHFSKVAPRGVDYLKRLQEVSFGPLDLYYWTWSNGGFFALLTAPLGFYGMWSRRREAIAALWPAWLLAMGGAVVLKFLPNPYRYFEYFFFGLLVGSALGLGALLRSLKAPAWTVAAVLFACLLGPTLRLDFYPKYRVALSMYGDKEPNQRKLLQAESNADTYLKAKADGKLDEAYGGMRNYLWSRQKKIWDIHVKVLTP